MLLQGTWTDGQGDSYTPPNFVCGGYNNISVPLKMQSKINGTNNISKVKGVMVFNASVNNISVILWESFLLLEETGVLEKTSTFSKSLENSRLIN